MANPTKLFWPCRSWRDYGEIVFVDSREEPLGPPTPTPPSVLKLQCDDAEWWLTAVAIRLATGGGIVMVSTGIKRVDGGWVHRNYLAR